MEPLYHNHEITILVVDDNPQNIQLIGQILMQSGYPGKFIKFSARRVDEL